MTEQIITLAFIAILVLFAFFGAIWGVVRGLRRTVWRGVWLLLTALLLFFTAGSIVDAIFYTKSSFIALPYNGQIHNSIFLWLEAIFESEVDFGGIAEEALLIEQFLNLSKLLLNSVIFAVLFLVLKYLLAPVSYLLYNLLFRSAEEKEYKRKQAQYKLNLKLYKLQVKNFHIVDGHGFADDFIEYEENLKEIKEDKKPSSLELLEALKQRIDKKTIEVKHQSRTDKENEAIKDLIEKGAAPSQLKKEIEKEKVVVNKVRAKKDEQDIKQLHKEEKEIDKIINNGKAEKVFGDSKHRPGEIIPADKIQKVEVEKEKPLQEKKEEFVPKEEYSPQQEKEVITRPEKPIKPARKRLWGMLVGALIGLFSCAMIINPVTGVLNLAVELNKRPAIVNVGSSEGLLFELIGTDEESNNVIKPFLNAYENSITNGALKYTGVNAISVFTFNLLSNIKINDITVNMTDDLLSLMDLAIESAEYSKLFITLNEDITVDELDSLIAGTKNILDKAFKVQVIRALGNEFLPLIKEYLLDTLSQVEESEFENKNVLIDMLSSMFTMILEDDESRAIDILKHDLFEFIEVLEMLNQNIMEDNVKTNESVLTIILKQSLEQDQDKLVNFLNKDKNATKIFEKILNTRIADSILPHVTYLMVNYLAGLDEIDMDVPDSLDEFKKLEISDAILNVVLEGINLLKEFDLSKGIDIDNLTVNVFISMGKVLDRVKDGLLPPATYDQLTNLYKEKLINYAIDAMGQETEILKAVYAVASSIPLVESWEDELTVLGVAFSGLFNEVNGISPIFDLEKEVDINDIDFQKLGEKLDVLLKGHNQKSSVIFGKAYKNADDESFDNFFKNNETPNVHLLIVNLLEMVVNIFKEDMPSDDIVSSLTNMVEQEIIPRIMDKNLNITWGVELNKISKLLEMQNIQDPEDQSISLSDLGELLDDFIDQDSLLIKESDIRQLVINIVSHLKESLLNEMQDEVIKNALANAIGSVDATGSIIYNLKNEKSISYKLELSHMANLFDIDFDSGDGTATLLGYLQLVDDDNNAIGLYNDYNIELPIEESYGKGGQLDSIVNNQSVAQNSKIITKQIINNILKVLIENLTGDSLDGEFAGLIDTIKNKLNTVDIESYENEFKAIQYLLDISKHVTLTGADENMFEKIGSYFDDIAFSKLVGDSGKQVLVAIIEQIENQAELTDLLSNINGAVNQLAGDENNIIDELLNNIENTDYNNYNFANQYKELALMKNIFEDISNATWLDNINISDIPNMKTNIYDISKKLESLQSNLISKAVATRYITVYIYSNLRDAMAESAPQLTEDYANYVANYGQQHLLTNIYSDINEVYWDAEWDNENAETIIIDELNDYNYALIKIINSYQDNLILP